MSYSREPRLDEHGEPIDPREVAALNHVDWSVLNDDEGWPYADDADVEAETGHTGRVHYKRRGSGNYY